MKTKDELIDDLLDLAFAEDLGDGDHTTLSTIPENAMGRSRLIIKEDGILAGVKVAEKVLHRVDPSIKMTVMIGDGAEVNKGDVAYTPPHTHTQAHTHMSYFKRKSLAC